MLKGMLKRALGVAAAAAMAVTGAVALSATANAAPVGSANIVLTGEIKQDENRTFKAFKLGDYTDVEYTGGVLESVGVSTDSDWSAQLEIAIGAAGLTDDYTSSQYNGNPAAYVASLAAGDHGADLREIAESMKKQTSATESEIAITTPAASPDAKVTVPVTDDGFYLITDSMGAPILIGSPVQVAEGIYENSIGSSGITLGEGELKPSSLPVPEKNVSDTDAVISFDGKSVYVGEELTYTVTVTVPNTTGYTEGNESLNAYTLYIKDVADPGLTVNQVNSVTLGGNLLTKDEDYTVEGPTASSGNTTTVVKLKNVAGYDDEDVVVTYSATVNDNALTDLGGVTNTAQVSRDNTNWGTPDTVTVRTYGFDFEKKNVDGEVVVGAKFVISVKNADNTKYLKYDSVKKTWSAAVNKDDATRISSGNDGKVSFQGLPLDVYTVEEVEAPEGYMNSVLPTFTVTLTDNDADGTAESKFGEDTWGLVDTDRHVVINVQNITQLPLTGAAGTMLFTVLGLLIAGAGVTVYMKSRSVKHALRG